MLRQSTSLNAIPKLEHLKARRELNRQEKDLMIEWATNNGKAARQRSVRQETTMFKAGTLPSTPSSTPSTSHEAIEAGQVVEEAEEKEEEEEEYDSDTDGEYPIADNDEEDSLDNLVFLRAVTTRSVRMVRVVHRE